MAVNTLQSIGDTIYILGTNHIAQASKESVHRMITQIHPDIVMIELDEERLQILLERETEAKKDMLIPTTPQESNPSDHGKQSDPTVDSPEIPPFLAAFEHIQQSMGGIMGIVPGDELLTAVHVVKELNIPLRMIDLPIEETMKRFARLQAQFPKEQDALMEELNMENLPNDETEIRKLFHMLEDPEAVRALLAEFRTQFPDLTKILIDDRNEYMVSQIKDYHTHHPSKQILVICGALHVTGIVSSLQSWLLSEPSSKE
ncbi:MAG: TraB domain-containing protein [Promethearchaeota archaeon]